MIKLNLAKKQSWWFWQKIIKQSSFVAKKDTRKRSQILYLQRSTLLLMKLTSLSFEVQIKSCYEFFQEVWSSTFTCSLSNFAFSKTHFIEVMKAKFGRSISRVRIFQQQKKLAQKEVKIETEQSGTLIYLFYLQLPKTVWHQRILKSSGTCFFSLRRVQGFATF